MMRTARKAKDAFINILCLLMSFLSGRCSYDKFTSFFRSKFISYRRKFSQSFEIESYNGKNILGVDEANRIIADAVESGRPFMAGRYGSTELRILWRVSDDGKGFIVPSEEPFRNLCTLSGFFPEDIKLMAEFADLMRQSTAQVDLIGIMFEIMDEWMLRTYGNDPDYCHFTSLEPFRASEPWTAKLEGKKVVVIHPFKNTIESQYRNANFFSPAKIYSLNLI